MIRFAFAGFRHPHVLDMYRRCSERADVEIVAACEEDAATRASLAQAGTVTITHDSFDRMLAETSAEVIAIGDYYSNRGPLALRALAAGRHVIADKPLCITLDERDQIEELARSQQRVVGCMLDMRDAPVFLGLRQLIQAGEIGPVQAISFGGQHPLNYGTRAAWYFEPGRHGGTINDIGIHAIDGIPWMTGLKWAEIEAARCWHHLPPAAPHFQGCGQMMLRLENGAGVLGDVSYISPDSFGYTAPFYWRFNVWGNGGMLEASSNTTAITLYKAGDTASREIPLPAGRPGGYLDSFLREIHGETADLHLSSADALRSTRLALAVQRAADTGACRVAFSPEGEFK